MFYDLKAARPSRRALLRIGSLGWLGLSLADVFRAEATQPTHKQNRMLPKKVKSCILIYYYGGPSHLDTWDLKPNAPAEVRGEFKARSTSVPGLRISEHLPRCAQVMHKLAIVRSFHHPMRNHNSAAVETLCGRTPIKGDLELLGDDPNSFPCYGAALSQMLPRTRSVPAHVALPHVMYNVVLLPGQRAGFLGSAYNPLQITNDPNDPAFQVDELSLPADFPLRRLDQRQSLLGVIDRQLQASEKHLAARPSDVFHDKAFSLLRSDAVRRSFAIDEEDQRTRDRYGRTKLGQSLLLARRLVEAGVRFVNVNDGVRNGQLENWDSHENNFSRLKKDLLPPADQGFSALIQDLDARGLLESTLVIALSEFGRTPRINKAAGRDHWPDCFSFVLAGGGIQGGITYGSSDKLGAFPEADGVTPGDLAATIFWRFGLDSAAEIKDLTGRPYRLAEGQPIHKLFSGA